MKADLSSLPGSCDESPDDILMAYARAIRDAPLEYGYAFDRDGRLLTTIKGGRTKIRFGHRDLFTLSECVFVHNHPNNSSFSLADMHAACMLNMLAMITVTTTMIFCMTPPAGDPYFTRAHYRDIARCYTIRSRLLPLSRRVQLRDEIWDAVTRDLNMRYRRVPIR
jgi:hypothetical protein